MPRHVALSLLVAVSIAIVPRSALAVVHAGDIAPDFHKQDLQGAPQTLFQYRGKVVVMFLLGYS